MKVAEGLVLRKHLAEKVKQLEPVKLNGEQGIFEIRTQRKKISDEVDEITTQLPRITLKEVTEEYDKYSRALRILDVKIQEANWTNTLDFNEAEYLGAPTKTKK